MTKEHGQKSISDMTTRELAAALQANEVVESDAGLLPLPFVDSCTGV